MTKDEYRALVKGLNALYSTDTAPLIGDQYKFDLWFSLLQDLEYKRACAAVKKLAMSQRYAPKPYDIRKAYAELSPDAVANTLSDMEAWSMVRDAIRNGTYGSAEEYAALPPVIQKAVGSSENLREWASLPSATVESVIQSNFLRAYTTAQERTAADALLRIGTTGEPVLQIED